MRQYFDTGRDLLRVCVKRASAWRAARMEVTGSGDTVRRRRHGSPAVWSPAVRGSWGTRRRYSRRTTTNTGHRSSATGQARHLVNTSNKAFATSTIRWSVNRSQRRIHHAQTPISSFPQKNCKKCTEILRFKRRQTAPFYAELSGEIPKPCLRS